MQDAWRCNTIFNGTGVLDIGVTGGGDYTFFFVFSINDTAIVIKCRAMPCRAVPCIQSKFIHKYRKRGEKKVLLFRFINRTIGNIVVYAYPLSVVTKYIVKVKITKQPTHNHTKKIDVCAFKIHDPNAEKMVKQNTECIKWQMFIFVSNGEPAKETL